MGEAFEGQVVHETPNRIASAIRYAWLGVTTALIPVYAFGFQHLPESVLLPISVAWLPLSFVMIPVMRHFAKTPERRSAKVRIDDKGIHIDEKVIVHRRHLRSGATHTATNGDVRVVLRHRHNVASSFGVTPVVVFIADHGVQADAMLAAAGVDLERQAFRATFLRPQAVWQVLLGVAIYVALSMAAFKVFWRFFSFNFDTFNPILATTPVLVAGAIAFAVYALIARTVVTVGNDGIEVRRMFRKTFVGLDEIREVRAEKKALIITRTTGERISLAHAAPIIEPVGNFGASDIAMERGLLADRIADALRSHKRRSQSGSALVALGRAERSPDEWFASLRAIGAGASDYRTRVIPVEELRRVVTDTTATSDVRVGAAIALRVADQAGAAERIRIAADATAAPDLRTLLKDIADAGDDDQVHRQLQRIG
jgi:hypothetical protein